MHDHFSMVVLDFDHYLMIIRFISHELSQESFILKRIIRGFFFRFIEYDDLL